MDCTCRDYQLYQEHEVTCPLFEAPLTQAEIRQLRALLRLPAGEAARRAVEAAR